MKNYGFNENQASFPSQYETAGSMDINPSCPYTSSPGMVNQEIIYNNQVTGNTYWGDIATLNLANPTTPQYVNFNGVYSHLRAKMSNKTSGTVDKILVRN